MPTQTDLTGVGMPPLQASILGNQPQAVTCAGTAQTTATAMLTHNTVLTAAGSQTGAILPSGGLMGTPYWTACASSTSAVIYCPSGHSLNGLSNNSLTLAQNKAAVLMRYAGNQWFSIITA